MGQNVKQLMNLNKGYKGVPYTHNISVSLTVHQNKVTLPTHPPKKSSTWLFTK